LSAVSIWESISGCLSFDPVPESPEPDLPCTRAFAWLPAVFFLVRPVCIRLLPVVPQGAHHWSYAKPLALSHFDHPPMTAWTIALFAAIGGDAAFFIFPAIARAGHGGYFAAGGGFRAGMPPFRASRE
jgi:hypothetical protein